MKNRRPVIGGEQVLARFDNARHTPDTASIFRNVDSLAMNAALDPSVRKTVRERARYVVGNVPYAWSMLRTYVTHVVGAWATVSFPRGGIPEGIRQKVVDDFDAWAKSVLNSCWTSLFFAGAFVQSVSDIIVDGKTRQGATIPSMALTGTVIVDALSAIRSLIDEEKDADDVLKSIDHGLKAFLSPYRDLSRVYHWRIQGEPPDGKKKKPLKRR